MKIREAEHSDIGRIAYLMLKWDEELPPKLRRLKGDAPYAEAAARAFFNNPYFLGRVVEVDGVVVGGYMVYRGMSIFSPDAYGQLLMWYVSPKHRGSRLLGLRLLRDAMALSKEEGLDHLEVYPWLEDLNTGKVLERLGFSPVATTFVLPLQERES